MEMFIEVLKAIFLGIVEGITEWLPISSTGHMILVDQFMQMRVSPEFKEMFFVVIQLGAILAVIILFWHKLFPFSKAPDHKIGVRKNTFALWGKILLACIPSGVIGLLFDNIIDEKLYNYVTVAITLIVYGILFIIIENWNKHRTAKVDDVYNITWQLALGIGAFQVLSLIPGTSRSGATIIGALLIGISRTAAAEFTFFLAVPTMAGASLYKVLKFVKNGYSMNLTEMIVLIIGTAVAFLVSVVIIKFLMAYVKKHDFKVFGVYRIILGIIVILYFLISGAVAA